MSTFCWAGAGVPGNTAAVAIAAAPARNCRRELDGAQQAQPRK